MSYCVSQLSQLPERAGSHEKDI